MHITLITGGSRSGKSSHALQLAEQHDGKRFFIATCPRVDDEMVERIARHRAEREGRGWVTLETECDLVGAFRQAAKADVILVDCLTLWVGNLLHHQADLDEDRMRYLCHELISCCLERPGRLYLVTNETGWGIIPNNRLARRFSDIAGRCNQELARVADEVILMVSGLAIQVKACP